MRAAASLLALFLWVGLAAGEPVSGRLEAGNGFAWGYAYDTELRDDGVFVRIGVHLVPTGGVTVPELERVKPGWEVGIEALWGGRFALQAPSGRRYPVRLDVDFRGLPVHHQVVVRPGKGRTDQLGWHLRDGPELAAHEVGHMLGAFDEYRGGATDPAGPVTDAASLMTSDPGPDCAPRARHFERLRVWAERSTGLPGWTVVPWAGLANQNDGTLARR